ncbi:hypothetical protein PF010_g16212 [Phytophthora fragariae]|uniref:Crinkler effector protein N-terminal domain-containing protein n=1 Tax=Phytophthora fragariae TaxID=53985 RepID=A0A6A3J5H0_9STRA|nr:hypothetical protein PF011_g19089 [Phytophthora fragariae]KAE9096778.1 hypothetical protein PF010_g16212 [Phytophthora fragariae]KAE9199604.1 hypothetical protein PF004_g19228 [Phytophthora fragariae]
MEVKMALPPANEIKLCCSVYHLAKTYSVGVRLDERVESVRVKLGKQLGAPPKDLRLSWAKNKGGDWVKSDEELKSFLSRGPVQNESGDTAFNRMWPPNLLSKFFDQQTPPHGVVHVLVEVKKNLKRRETDVEAPSALKARKTSSTLRTLIPILNLDELKATAFKSGGLPKDGDFLKLFEWDDDDCGEVKDIQAIKDIVGFTCSEFYVRKETLCVLENFKKFLQVKLGVTTEEFRKEQFIFMGSPGTGKSCILALICFYLAIEKNVPVVWHRVAAVGLPVTRLFHQGKYYEWADRKGDIYSTIVDSRSGGGFDRANCWFCIDGLSQEQLARTSFGTAFTLLAASGQFSRKGESGLKQETCLLPYWRQVDLEDLAVKLLNVHESNAADRYFVSGGSVLFFVYQVEKTRSVASMTLRRVNFEDADALLAPVGSYSEKEIEHIRMIGVPNYKDPKQYTDPECWKALVTSKMAMEYLLTLKKPDYFHKLFVTVKDVNDPQLHSLVLENLFRSIAYNQNSVSISYMKYDNVDRTTHRDPEHLIMREDMGVVKFGRSTGSDESLNVKREGETMDEYAAAVERWAKNPDEMDYWIPASGTCDTIDAVAKWEFKSETDDSGVDSTPVAVERFCLLQLSVANPMGEPHKCEASVVLRLAQPFLDAGKQVCYMALVCGGDEAKWDTHRRAEQKMVTRMEKFRLKPAVMEEDGSPPSFPLYVATYALL